MKKLIIAAVVMGAIGGGVGLYLMNMKPTGIADLEATASVSANEVFAAFEGDTAKANAQYLGKVLEVHGAIESVEAGGDSTNIIILSAEGAMMGGVQATLLAGQSADALNVGSEVKMKCRCSGKEEMFGSVVMMDCLIVN